MLGEVFSSTFLKLPKSNPNFFSVSKFAHLGNGFTPWQIIHKILGLQQSVSRETAFSWWNVVMYLFSNSQLIIFIRYFGTKF
jgi:hypothetical protein